MIADYSKEIRSQHAHCNGMSYIGIILVKIQVGEPNKLEPPRQQPPGNVPKLDRGENFSHEMIGKCLWVYKCPQLTMNIKEKPKMEIKPGACPQFSLAATKTE